MFDRYSQRSAQGVKIMLVMVVVLLCLLVGQLAATASNCPTFDPCPGVNCTGHYEYQMSCCATIQSDPDCNPAGQVSCCDFTCVFYNQQCNGNQSECAARINSVGPKCGLQCSGSICGA